MIAQGYEALKADEIVSHLATTFNVRIKKDWGWYQQTVATGNMSLSDPGASYTCSQVWHDGAWQLRDLTIVRDAVQAISKAMGNTGGNGPGKFQSAMQNRPVYVLRRSGTDTRSWSPPGPLAFVADIIVRDLTPDDLYETHSIVHEFGHVWDERTGWKLSSGMAAALGTFQCYWGPRGRACRYDVTKGKEKPVGDPYNPYPNDDKSYPLPREIEGPWEDWADSFAVYVYPNYYASKTGYNLLGPIRRQFISDQINALP
jgi:hypothetical protein